MAFALSAEREQKFAEILSRYPNKMAACIPVLHLCQEANQNWVSEEVIDFVARRLDLSPAHVKGVVTFYTLFNQKPPGKHQVWVCRTLSCALLRLQPQIQIKIDHGEGTAVSLHDGTWLPLPDGVGRKRAE